MALGVPANLLGIMVQGDIGEYTIYTDRHGRKVVYPKAPPKEPPSAAQTQLRNRFRAALINWMQLTPEERDAYKRATRNCNAAITPTGLWISGSITHDTTSIQTISRQTGIHLVNPPPT